MTNEQWTVLRELLDRALDEPERREEILEDLRESKPELAAELERLLADLDDCDDLDEPPARTAWVGQTVGPYRVEREIGRGGSGLVLLAVRRESDVTVQVALKILRLDYLRDAPRRSFQRELRVLARLSHPGIARLIDWGSIADGLLFLAIEYVEGERIDAYCESRGLAVRERLRILRQVCAAVEHAHRNLIVHRDLKPSNILVEAGGVAKLLDFGIASELDSESATTYLHRALTPAYASPEQLQGKPVTVATDVYSLGLVLYKLLTGRLPDVTKGAAVSFSGNQEMDPDLQSIVVKATHAEPEDRYLSMEQFDDDLGRYLDGRPILARRPTAFYVARRFVARNRLNVIAGAAFVILLFVTAAVAGWKWHAANANLNEARANYSELRSFARAVLSNVDASATRSATEEQSRMSAVVAQHLDALSQGRGDDPELQLEIARAYLQLGTAQGGDTRPNQGDPNGAMVNYQHAYRIALQQWRAHADLESGRVLVTAAGSIAPLMPDPGPAANFLKSAIAAASGALEKEPRDVDTLHVFCNAHGTLAQRERRAGDLDAAAHDFGTAIALADRALAEQPKNPALLNEKEAWTSELAGTIGAEGNYQQAFEAQTLAWNIALQALALAPDHHTRRQVAFKLLSLSETQRNLGRLSDAADDARGAAKTLVAIANEDAANDQAKAEVALAYYRLGDALAAAGKVGESADAFQRAMAIRLDQMDRHPANLQAQRNAEMSLTRTGQLAIAGGQFAAAEKALKRAIAVGEGLRAQSPTDVYVTADLAESYFAKAACERAAGRDVAEDLAKASALWMECRRRSPLDKRLARSLEEVSRELIGAGARK